TARNARARAPRTTPLSWWTSARPGPAARPGTTYRSHNQENDRMSTFQLRHYIDRLRAEGYTVRDDHGEDPDLIDINGRAVDTWRENYPYDQRMDRNQYEVEKYLLQIELLKFQRWQADSGHRQIIVFEG